MIKICSLTVSLSPLLFKFIHSPLSQPLSDGSQRPYPIQRPQGTHSPGALHSTGLQHSTGRQGCLGKLKNHIPCSAANTHLEEATETCFMYSLTLNKLKKTDCNYHPCLSRRPHSKGKRAQSRIKGTEVHTAAYRPDF